MRYVFLLITILASLEGRDLTFFAVGDPHYGYEMYPGNEKINKEVIDDMNQLPGTLYEDSGEAVSEPLGVLVMGDLTGTGSTWDWGGFWAGHHFDGFDDDYEVNGNGRVRYPVYEAYGNHDIPRGTLAVLNGIYYRNQVRSTPVNISKEGLHYSWDWEDVHFINLNIYPGGPGEAQDSIEFLKKDLKENLRAVDAPIIIYHHYDYLSDSWTEAEREYFYQVIKEFNVIALLHGHAHPTYFDYWHAIPVISVPTAMDNKYLVVQVKENQLIISERSQGDWNKGWTFNFNQ